MVSTKQPIPDFDKRAKKKKKRWFNVCELPPHRCMLCIPTPRRGVYNKFSFNVLFLKYCP